MRYSDQIQSKMKYITLVSMFLIGLSIYAQSLDSIQQLDAVIVTATKSPINSKSSGKVITKLTKKDFERFPQKTVSQFLNNVMGFEVNGSQSVMGKNQLAYVRGGKPSQILILIDGIPQIDPSGIDLSTDLNALSINQIESMEIMRGAAGTLYGSGASTAVVNIKTLQNSPNDFTVNIGSSIGTYRNQKPGIFSGFSWLQNASVKGAMEKFNYLISYAGNNTKGFSEAISSNHTIDFKSNPFEHQNLLIKTGLNLNNQWQMTLKGQYKHLYHVLDGGAFTDSHDDDYNNNIWDLGFYTQYHSDKINFNWNNNYKSITRDYHLFDSWMAILNPYNYEGNSYISDAYATFYVNDRFELLSGLNVNLHHASQNTPYGEMTSNIATFNTIEPYFNFRIKNLYGFYLSAGTRVNYHSNYGENFSVSFNPSYVYEINENSYIKIMSSWSTAYLVPSLYQLFSAYGNQNLQPEYSETQEVGIEFHASDHFKISSSYFKRLEKDAIIFYADPVTNQSLYNNEKGEQMIVSGVETSAAMTFNKFNTSIGYAYTELSKERPFSVPKHKWQALLNYNLNETFSVALNYKYLSDRTQMDYSVYPFQIQTLKKFHLVDLVWHTQLIKNKWSIDFSVDNIFNENYVETIGYNTLGRNLAVSMRYQIK